MKDFEFISAKNNLSEFLIIKNERVYNVTQKIVLSSKVKLNVNCSPNSKQLLTAIKQCGDNSVFTLDNNTLKIKGKSFSAKINCIEQHVPNIEYFGETFEIDGEDLKKKLKLIHKFVNCDNNHIWATGILFFKDRVFATNNIVLVESKLNKEFPEICNLPLNTVEVIINKKEAPINVQCNERMVTFWYENDSFITSPKLSLEWPNVVSMLEQNNSNDSIELDKQFFDKIAALETFLQNDGCVYLNNNIVSTHEKKEVGSYVELDTQFFKTKAKFRLKDLLLLNNICTHIDTSSFPKPAFISGENINGIIIGVPF